MIISNAAAWAIVMWVGACTPSDDPNQMCEGRLVSGLIWGTPEQCDVELLNNPMPGAECREIVSVAGQDDVGDGPASLDDVLRSMENDAGVQHL